MRLAIITPADMTAVTEIRGAIMRQICDTFMKNITAHSGQW
ncbi:conserved hypothetical protein [Pantoea brenneri]|uniref:Uncharacterized protein n=1 Tax=Pantoea brenneri TaxID=472694 RepID=A0AAX3J881_9GAMM|nr:conserved hypothetical protein [Pantoea brenneri]